MTEKKIQNLRKDFDKALGRLEEALGVEATRLIKDGTIKRFEFTFELAWKLMQAIIQFQGLDAKSPKKSIRIAAQIGLVDNPDEWITYLEKRNLTAHVYDLDMADEVYECAKLFLPDGRKLLQCAETLNED